MSEGNTFDLFMDLQSEFKFKVNLNVEGASTLDVDEPPPNRTGRRPQTQLAFSRRRGNCMSASLLSCLIKARINVTEMHTGVRATLQRNERGRLRVSAIEVLIEPEVATEDVQRMNRCLDVLEDYCVVAQSIRDGIAVTAEVRPKALAFAAI